MKVLNTKTNLSWKVLFNDGANWRVGIYKPQFKNLKEIKILEKHNVPELFVLLAGEINLVILKNKKIQTIKLKKNQPLVINSYHNGFSPKSNGISLVVERGKFTTKYLDLKTKKIIKKVVVRKGDKK